PNSSARAFAAAKLISAQALISMFRNMGDSRKYAADILPQPIIPTPSVLVISFSSLESSYGFDGTARKPGIIRRVIVFHDEIADRRLAQSRKQGSPVDGPVTNIFPTVFIGFFT